MATQQSWAAWLLDSYASSVSPVTSDSPYRHHDDSPSISESSHATSSPSRASSLSPMSSISNSSAYGPYSSADLDLEAQSTKQTSSLSDRRKAAAKLENINTNRAVSQQHTRQSSTQFLSVGRGGAGNYTSSTSEIAPPKRSPSLPVSLSARSASGSRNPSPTSLHFVHPGRGGAGNFANAADVGSRNETEKEQEERLAAEQRRDQIAEEVDGLLQPPPGAWLGGRRKSEIMDEVV
ncbi:hypothetical protein LTR20_002868 [Exophiala xenobiotica]|nr:hypothetical protein LTR93_003051 [Exophiala xenobiotica]KAK5390410.1 hypothetical protein LTS13_000491 [Exophiala xenobiotica]KAK5403628.1 hypothetical protein LTR79_000381 [Exophiala xenobiotica]KAK5414677.1 hypothetical protein LTR06_004492 [Exophiala xenobiotica]KAK5468522.1 hypothetical protein LTR20_002868 [Exophiala xenobiotica]